MISAEIVGVSEVIVFFFFFPLDNVRISVLRVVFCLFFS